MEQTLLVNSLRLVVHVSLPFLLAVLAGALAAGVLRAATQIDDQSIGHFGRVSMLAVLLYVVGGSFFAKVASFAASVWGTAAFYP